MKPLKYFLVFLFLTGMNLTLNAQDIITKKNGDEIKSKVMEVGSENVKYKKYGDNSGPTYSISKSEIFMIKYENGDKDMFDKTTQSTTQAVVPAQQQPQQQDQRPQQQEQQLPQTQAQATATQQPTTNQPVNRKAYIGIGIGGASLSEDYSNVENGGVQFNINFGYLFSKNVGVTASFFTTSYSMTNYTDATIGLTGFVTGPLFSTATATKDFEFDLRPMIGFASASVTVGKQSGSTDETGFVAAVGGSVRWNCSSRISLSANLDYYNSTISDVDLSSFGVSVGVNYRF